MIFLKLTKLLIWSGIYYIQEKKSDVIFNIIVNNIRDIGCVAIKLTQWILPKLEMIYSIDTSKSEHRWFLELEKVYEDCNYHSLEYTKNLYKEEFGHDIEDDFIIQEAIASGSIGQVYKINSKDDNKDYAMKVIHPNVDSDIWIIDWILYILTTFPFIGTKVRYYIPIDIHQFIRDFKIQIDMVNEANNCLTFARSNQDNDIYIIPTINRVSKKILIMSYEEGIAFDKLECSEYMKQKIILLGKIFVKGNQYSDHLMHGDLHKGNWKVRLKNGTIPQIIIYDYGFCWKLPDFLKDPKKNIFIDQALLTPISNIDNYILACNYILNNKSPIERIRDILFLTRDELISEGYDIGGIYDDPVFLMKLTIRLCREDNYLIDSFALQTIIIHTQLTGNFLKYGLTRRDRGDEFAMNQILDMINLCKIYNIAIEYSKVIIEEYNNLSKSVERKSLFETSTYDNNFDQFPNLKEMAIS